MFIGYAARYGRGVLAERLALSRVTQRVVET
jgi:hypothetical protein